MANDIIGTSGDDSLVGGDLADSIRGLGGDDTLRGATGDDTLDGGAGDDLADYTTSPAGVVVTLGSLPARPPQPSQSATEGDDLLIGSRPGSTILGLGGDDTIDASGGDNSLDGGAGNDVLRDNFDGVDSDGDTMAGGDGNDLLLSFVGVDSLDGGLGKDTIRLTSFFSGTASGGGGDDFIEFGDSATVAGGEGSDRFQPTSLFGSVSVVTDFVAGPGGDILDVGRIVEELEEFTSGVDPFTNGFLRLRQDGTDTVLESNIAGGGENRDSLVRLQNVSSTDIGAENLAGANPSIGFNLAGTAEDEILTGGRSDDSIDGGGGRDQLFGEFGSDTLFGGDGDDFISTGEPRFERGGPFGDGGNVASGGNGDDAFVSFATGASDTLTGGEGSDRFQVPIGLDDGFGGIVVASPFVVTDFEVGEGGDVLGLQEFFFFGFGFPIPADGALFPNFVRLLQDGSDTLVQINTGEDPEFFPFFEPVARLQNVAADTLVPFNLDGLDPAGGPAIGEVVNGGAGTDLVRGGFGADTIFGAAGNDEVTGETGNDSIDGGDGADVIGGDAGDDTLQGGAGNDTVDGVPDFLETPRDQGADSLVGGSGDDLLLSFGGDRDDGDTLVGGAGRDVFRIDFERGSGIVDIRDFVPGSGDSVVIAVDDRSVRPIDFSDPERVRLLQAGDDVEIQVLAGTTAETVAILRNVQASELTPRDFGAVPGSASDGFGDVDALRRIENVSGSAFADTITGDDDANKLDGGGGADLLFGVDGADTLLGGGGDDSVAAGANNDWASGGLGDDRLIGEAGSDVLRGEAGVDVLLAGIGRDTLDGGLGDDVLRGGGGGDDLRGGGDDDALYGDSGSDRLDGGDGGDILRGGSEADTLAGGSGADTLIGGFGRDLLGGGTGADRFVYNSAADSAPGQRDRILDFEGAGTTGGDLIDLSAIDANTTVLGNQAFVLLAAGAAFTAAGQLRRDEVNGETILRGTLDADLATVEVEILLQDGAVAAGVYTADDFVL